MADEIQNEVEKQKAIVEPVQQEAPPPKPLGEQEQQMATDIGTGISSGTNPDAILQTLASSPNASPEGGGHDVQTFQQLISGKYADIWSTAVYGNSENNLYHRDYTMREFVRNHPQEAQELQEAYLLANRRDNDWIAKAQRQVLQLQEHPESIPPEDPKYAGLTANLESDPLYLEIAEKQKKAELQAKLGTDDPDSIRAMTTEQYVQGLSTQQALQLDMQHVRAIRDEFAKRAPDRLLLYGQRSRTKVYRDPDGMLNPDRDPAFPRDLSEFGKQDNFPKFAAQYPEKARAYAEIYPELRQYLPETSVVSPQEVNQKIQAEVAELKDLNTEDMEQRRKELQARLQLSSITLNDTLVGLSEQPEFTWVKTDKIVGRTWEQPDGWAAEYQGRTGRIVTVAQEIINGDAEQVFHAEKNNERIKLATIDGPHGPMYYVEDGTHRVTASMTVGLAEIPCDVRRVTYPLKEFASDAYQVEDWQKKISLGLIDGDIQDLQTSTGETIKQLVVKGEVVPWIRTTSQADLLKISRTYESLYPGSLDNLTIPKQALLDPVANNYYMAGRWEEWVQNHPEDTSVAAVPSKGESTSSSEIASAVSIDEKSDIKDEEKRIPKEYLDVTNKWLYDQQQISILFALMGIGRGNDFAISNNSSVTFEGGERKETVEQSTTEDYEKLQGMLESVGLHATYRLESQNPKGARIYFSLSEDNLQQLLTMSEQTGGTKEAWDRYGELYGFPKTAVEAFPDHLIPYEELPENIRESSFYQVLPFRLSKDHYEEEWNQFLHNFKAVTQRYPGLVEDFQAIRQSIERNDKYEPHTILK